MVKVLDNSNRFKRLVSSLKKRSTISFLLVVFLVIGFLVTYKQLYQQQDIRQQAATDYPTGFTEQQLVNGISGGTAMAFAPDGRLFVAEQGGKIWVVKNGQKLPTPFTTLNVKSDGERGIEGIVFDPNFAQNNYVYVYYTTNTSDSHNRLSRLTANGDTASPTETVIYDFDSHGASNHNGGALNFGTDGKLYVTTGDNASGSNAQTLTNDHGKILRINPVPDDPATTGIDERVPADNPASFTTLRSGTFRTESPTGKYRSIWAIGFRNPFTAAIQPGTGKLHINDVGDNGGIRWEEINLASKGENYGWPEAYGMQGNQDSRLTKPLYTYQTEGCAITGGTFYNPVNNNFPAGYVGKYFFADYCGDWIKILDTSNSTVSTFASAISEPVDLKVGPDGSLYYLARGSNAVYKVSFGGVSAVAIASPLTGAAPLAVSFSASGSTDSQNQPLTYAWNFGDGATGTGISPSHTYAQDGVYTAVVTATNNNTQSSTASVTISVGNQQTVTFNDYSGQNVALTGIYPTGVINWGSGNTWLVSAPFGSLTTKNLSFSGAGITSGTFTFISPKRLLSIDAYNGGTSSTTITLSCAGNTTKTFALSSGQLANIITNWSANCSQITLSSTNGWDTNFDNFVYSDGPGTPSVTTTPSIAPANQAPTASILTPASGSLYNSGTTINFSGSGTDPEDGTLPGNSFTWLVERHHNDGTAHTHPVLGPVNGTSGSFNAPSADEKSVNVFYRINLTVTDSKGQSSVKVSRDILPRTVSLTLNTVPAGGQLFLDGVGITTPHTFGSVVGLVREIGAPDTRMINSQTYNFSSWSDGGTLMHDITTPISNTTYTTTYVSPTSTPTPTSSFRIGDINRDNKVDVQDLSYMLSNWGTNNALADLNHNGTVNTLDLSILLSNWKST